MRLIRSHRDHTNTEVVSGWSAIRKLAEYGGVPWLCRIARYPSGVVPPVGVFHWEFQSAVLCLLVWAIWHTICSLLICLPCFGAEVRGVLRLNSSYTVDLPPERYSAAP